MLVSQKGEIMSRQQDFILHQLFGNKINGTFVDVGSVSLSVRRYFLEFWIYPHIYVGFHGPGSQGTMLPRMNPHS